MTGGAAAVSSPPAIDIGNIGAVAVAEEEASIVCKTLKERDE
jgi:hypothetical protein